MELSAAETAGRGSHTRRSPGIEENEQMVDLIISYFAVDENEDSTNSKGGNS